MVEDAPEVVLLVYIIACGHQQEILGQFQLCILTSTTVAGVRRSSASVCVCQHVKTKTAETTIIKLATVTVHHE